MRVSRLSCCQLLKTRMKQQRTCLARPVIKYTSAATHTPHSSERAIKNQSIEVSAYSQGEPGECAPAGEDLVRPGMWAFRCLDTCQHGGLKHGVVSTSQSAQKHSRRRSSVSCGRQKTGADINQTHFTVRPSEPSHTFTPSPFTTSPTHSTRTMFTNLLAAVTLAIAASSCVAKDIIGSEVENNCPEGSAPCFKRSESFAWCTPRVLRPDASLTHPFNAALQLWGGADPEDACVRWMSICDSNPNAGGSQAMSGGCAPKVSCLAVSLYRP